MMFTQKTFKAIKLMSFVVVATISNGHAQTIVAPHNPDVVVDTPMKGGYMNNALIDYSPNCPGGPGTCGNNQFSAIVLDTNSAISTSMQSLLYISDGVNPVQVYAIKGGKPDVIVGNNTSSPKDYMVGVVYSKVSSCTPVNGDIYLDIYDFTNVGGIGGPTLVSGPTTYLISDGKHTCRGDAHIDIVAQSSTPFLSGQPLCNQFAIIFSDTLQNLPTSCGNPPGTPNPQHGVNIYWASFSSPGSGTVQLDPYTHTVSTFINADVAAVERYSSLSGYYNEAIYTYIRNDGTLYKNEWQSGTSTPATAPTILDTHINFFPRIDAIDNYNVNSPTGGFAYYDIAACTRTVPFKVYEYNNVASGPTLITAFGHPDYFPTVTNGLNRTYTIGYYSNDSVDDMFTKDISWTTGLPVSTNYFKVNLTPIHYVPNISIFTSVNATCNTNMSLTYDQYLMPCWSDALLLKDKIEMAITAFKSTGVNTVNNETSWKVVPNPATNYVMLFTSLNNVTGYGYTVSDITGRILLKAALSSNNEQIDISKLTSGMYLLNIKHGTDCVKTMKIIKE